MGCVPFLVLACGDGDGNSDGNDSDGSTETAEASALDAGEMAGEMAVVDSFVEGRDSCDPEAGLTYTNFGDPFLGQWCTSCHSSALPEGMRQKAPVGMDFDSYDGIVGNIDRIYARAADANETMPPVGGPDADARRLLGEWLACGAPGVPEDLEGGEPVDTGGTTDPGEDDPTMMENTTASLTPGLADDDCPSVQVRDQMLAGCCTDGMCAGVAAMSGNTVIPEGMIACVSFDDGTTPATCGE